MTADDAIDPGTTITVSAAASLTEAFDELISEFETENPDIDVVLNLASSGSLRMQIEAGAPIDVFASASGRHMDILDSKGMIDNSSRADFATNSLVLVVPGNSDLAITNIDDLTSSEVKKLTMGHPDTVPVGKYAKQSLTEAGIWEEVEGKIIFAEHVKQVLTYVETGEVDAGFVYMTDLENSGSGNINFVCKPSLSSEIIYPIAIVKSSGNKEEADRFVDFVTGEKGQMILKSYGFSC
ncbi:molybdate ABC transporter substrate-binding protein [Methanococcoides sp. FTZ1]|uniref:molybdate ABC transporter substrate-binding protein n=1 Tax=Methanococcoides sp. FTZ1 TaxID=3439061 RepID=UPI003F836EB5